MPWQLFSCCIGMWRTVEGHDSRITVCMKECEHKLCLGNYLAVASVCGGQWKAITPELQWSATLVV